MAVIDTSMNFPENCHFCKKEDCFYNHHGWDIDGKNYRTDRHPSCPLEEVPTGKWEIQNGILAHLLVCSNCGNEINITEAVHLDYYKNHFKYCPNCGAKMEQQGENTDGSNN